MQGIEEKTTSNERFGYRARNLLNEKYEEKFVCFVDVLGTRKEFERSKAPADVALPNLIFNHVKEANIEYANGLQIVHFSDCAYIVADKNNIEAFLTYISLLYFELLTSDNSGRYRLLRGGIAFGEVYCKPELNCIVGPAVAASCKLEENRFNKYPRIMIENETFFILASLPNSFHEFPIDSRDSKCYLDFISIVRYKRRFTNKLLNCTLKWIKNEEKKQTEDSIKEKYEWMKDYLNEKMKE